MKITVKRNDFFFIDNEEIKDNLKELINYFQLYMGKEGKKVDVLPYMHQISAFKKILNNKQLMMTAGTSSGKTLSHAIPLFYKIKEGLIEKILLLYPTRALLQDQLVEMNELAKVYKLKEEIAVIKGGMNKAQVIQALNKKVIIATPDSIYWFFNKNVKYSSFLIYGLSQVNEVVIDEAHLFSGLVLNNLVFLIQRMRKLADLINKEQKYHILTATANESLENIYQNDVKEVSGKSNCGNIETEFINKDSNGKYTKELFTESFQKEVINNNQKISCVGILNSAKVAHQLFYNNTQGIDMEELMEENIEQLFTDSLKISTSSLLKNIKNEEQKQEVKEFLSKKKNIAILMNNISLRNYLNIINKIEVDFNNEKFFSIFSDYIEEGYKRFKRIIEQANKEKGDFVNNLEEKIAGDKYVNELYIGLRVGENISIYDNSTEVLRKIIDDISIAKDLFIDKMDKGEKLIIEKEKNKRYLKVKDVKYDDKKYFHYNSRFLDKVVNELNLWEAQITSSLQDIKELKVEVEIFKKIFGDQLDNSWIKKTKSFRYIANWKQNKDILVILYTGSMSNNIREGLIKFFNQVDYDKKILLSTSAVEVGVDFDCDLLITEETNVASFLQRFGRAGRSGKDSKVKVFVTGDSYIKLKNKLRTKNKISRRGFSRLIENVFEEIRSIEDREFLEAYHYIINQNLGRIEEKLNQNFSKKTKELAKKLRKEVDLNYGLRGTMPSVSLRGGVSKSPFYILRFLENGDLIDSDSPFEIAYSEKSFDSLIWENYDNSEDVYVDINSTLKHSKLMFIKEGKCLKPYVREGICDRYEKEFWRRYAEFNNTNKEIFESNLYNDLKDYDKAMLKYLLTENNKFVLGFGNIFLNKDSGPIMIEDRRFNIPNQFFLSLFGKEEKQEKYMEWLRKNKIFDYGELIVDDTNYENRLNEEHMSRNPNGIVLLEKINGALFYLYKNIIKAQKEGELI